MKNGNAKILLPVLLVLLAGTFSCGKKFLDEPPRGATIEDLLNNPQDGAQRIIGAVYSRLYDWEHIPFPGSGFPVLLPTMQIKEVRLAMEVEIKLNWMDG
jgi:hypothetical protein